MPVRCLAGSRRRCSRVWEPFDKMMARTASGTGMAGGTVNFEKIDAASREGARKRAAEGADLASQNVFWKRSFERFLGCPWSGSGWWSEPVEHDPDHRPLDHRFVSLG